MNREPVKSAAIIAAGYDAGTGEAEIEYHDGRVYRYREISPAIWAGFQAADSKGRFASRNFRDGQPIAAAPRSPAEIAARPLDLMRFDDCCTPRFHLAVARGQVPYTDGSIWRCPRCSVEWRAESVEPVTVWKPVPQIEVFRMPRR
jgi:hypothetical protein